MTAGLAILLVTGGFFAYGQYGQYQANQEVQTILPPDVILDTPTPEIVQAVSEPTLTPVEATGVPSESSTPQIVLPSASPSPIPTQTPIAVMPMQRLIATSIGLDTKVVEAPIINGEWTVPKFVAGHLLGTAQPLEGSNIVLSGHVQSLSSGNVFARIGELKIGDVIRVYTRAAVITYVVSQQRVVANNDIAVVRPSPQEILTLITCTGTWLPLQRDYDRRIVVIASRQS
jgi:LPXTG-site transpeptidase (sortase) family protein